MSIIPPPAPTYTFYSPLAPASILTSEVIADLPQLSYSEEGDSRRGQGVQALNQEGIFTYFNSLQPPAIKVPSQALPNCKGVKINKTSAWQEDEGVQRFLAVLENDPCPNKSNFLAYLKTQSDVILLGCDEVGRGPIFGSVVGGAAILGNRYPGELLASLAEDGKLAQQATKKSKKASKDIDSKDADDTYKEVTFPTQAQVEEVQDAQTTNPFYHSLGLGLPPYLHPHYLDFFAAEKDSKALTEKARENLFRIFDLHTVRANPKVGRGFAFSRGNKKDYKASNYQQLVHKLGYDLSLKAESILVHLNERSAMHIDYSDIGTQARLAMAQASRRLLTEDLVAQLAYKYKLDYATFEGMWKSCHQALVQRTIEASKDLSPYLKWLSFKEAFLSFIAPLKDQAVYSTLARIPQAIVILVDGNQFLEAEGLEQFPQLALVKGDTKVKEIALASIFAKVHRDRVITNMELYEGLSPLYGLASNKGYPSPSHQAAIAQEGASYHHRFSFAPLKGLYQEAVNPWQPLCMVQHTVIPVTNSKGEAEEKLFARMRVNLHRGVFPRGARNLSEAEIENIFHRDRKYWLLEQIYALSEVGNLAYRIGEPIQDKELPLLLQAAGKAPDKLFYQTSWSKPLNFKKFQDYIADKSTFDSEKGGPELESWVDDYIFLRAFFEGEVLKVSRKAKS